MNWLRITLATVSLILTFRVVVAETPVPPKVMPLPGETFLVQGRPAFLIRPEARSGEGPVPWVWYAPTLPGLPGVEERWMFERFTRAGFAIAGIDVGESYGSPDGRALFSALHEELTTRRGLATKAVLLGRSRGGLMTLSWAAENADKVAGFAGIYPVCSPASYPGIAKAAGAYRMTAEELASRLAEHDPVDRLAALARAGVPLFAIHGDQDATVPLAANSGAVKRRYDALGGRMQLIVPAGQGHSMWPGFFESQELVDFVVATGTAAARAPALTVSSPLDYQVIQRHSKSRGRVRIVGRLTGAGKGQSAVVIEGRIVGAGEAGAEPGPWRRLVRGLRTEEFEAEMEVPSGGWYRLEVRAVRRAEVLSGASVEHVGVGEIFVVTGQSNSANHGEERQAVRSGKVTTFDGRRWRLAHDPQPGASGDAGSFLPPFGDALAGRLGVPVGFIACGIGATSVREWLPKGARFPNPPTLVGRVRQLPDGGWESRGDAFEMLVARMKSAGPRGFRAVLWHQGESDANQADATRTLSGSLYREYLERIIRETRRETGWKAPWFVAQVSYHVPGDEASPDIRAAQASLWKDGLALEGPDSDAIKGEFRDSGGKGVHFSGPGLRKHAEAWVEKVAPWLERQVR